MRRSLWRPCLYVPMVVLLSMGWAGYDEMWLPVRSVLALVLAGGAGLESGRSSLAFVRLSRGPLWSMSRQAWL